MEAAIAELEDLNKCKTLDDTLKSDEFEKNYNSYKFVTYTYGYDNDTLEDTGRYPQ